MGHNCIGGGSSRMTSSLSSRRYSRMLQVAVNGLVLDPTTPLEMIETPHLFKLPLRSAPGRV